MKIRVRFAPSPTGFIHVGNVRTALFNWLFARRFNGDFILRIEDTDAERSEKRYETRLIQDLQWLGLLWDEGPGVEGSVGPYRQSERSSFYETALRKLKEEGKLYACYCTAEELVLRREQALKEGKPPKYDRRCVDLTNREKAKFEAQGRKPALRFFIPNHAVSFEDLVRGRLAVEPNILEDFVVVRSNGLPNYNFACAVDDGSMGITHVIRGEDHIANTHKQSLIYQAVGWEPPRFAHLPLIMGPDRKPLSKRHGPTTIHTFKENGYLPEALVNHLALLGWSHPEGKEDLEIEEIIQNFSLDRISKSSAVFDYAKLKYLNGRKLRRLPLPTLADMAKEQLVGANAPISEICSRRPDFLVLMVRALRDRIDLLTDFPSAASFLFQREEPSAEARVYLNKTSAAAAGCLYQRLVEHSDFDATIFKKAIKAVGKEKGIKGKNLWMPVRVALTSRIEGPELADVIELLGPEETLARLLKAANEEW